MRKQIRFKKKMKNFILKCSATAISIGCALAACSLDSENWKIFLAALMLGALWLCMFSYANDFFCQKEKRYE